jgi:RNA polymerase sigma-70 factor (ECF subfamily)
MRPAATSGRDARFPTTCWTLILEGRHDDARRDDALEEVLRRYWKPVYCYMRRKGLDGDAAQDAVQGLFAQLLERRFLERLDPARGHLRSYLKAAADHHAISAHARASARKRGGGVRFVPVDVAQGEAALAAAPADPGDALDREWALGIMERALLRLRDERQRGQGSVSADAVLRYFGLGEACSYAEAAARSGTSVPRLKAALHRARRRFRALLLEEVEATVAPGRGAVELHQLFRLLAS